MVILDRSDGFYCGRAAPKDRSMMNVTFNLTSREMENVFLAEAPRCRIFRTFQAIAP